MKTTLKVFAFLLMAGASAIAQVAPEATGPVGLVNHLEYALRYGQAAEFGGNLGTWQTSNVSGTASYDNGSVRAPFAMQYGGGYTWTLSGPTYGSGLFQRLYLMQGLEGKKWGVTASDNVSYTPQSPVTGFTGIPGTGEPIGIPNPTTGNSQTILTLNTHVVDNSAVGAIEHKLSASTTLNGTGGYEMLRYPNNDGLNTDTYTANGLVTQRLNGRDSLTGNYQYSLFSYPGYTVTFETQAGLFGFSRLLSRKLTVAAAAGPQWIMSTDTQAVPSSLTFAANAAINYISKPTSMSLAYMHGTNGGAGYLLGAKWDSVDGNLSRAFGPTLLVGVTGGYGRTSGLNNGTASTTTTTTTTGPSSSGATNNYYGGAQVTWRISRTLIAFANYTGLAQSSSVQLPTNVITQFLQTVGFGIGYSPQNANTR
jgi:hypothetical protein